MLVFTNATTAFINTLHSYMKINIDTKVLTVTAC